METRRYKIPRNAPCTCYYCTGDVIGYREKKALDQYEDSMEEYEQEEDEQDHKD